MQARANKKAIIIGGGIAGVTAAIALRRAGMDVNVYERTRELREVGSGLPLWINALKPLQKLGLADALATLIMPVSTGRITTWQGHILADIRKEELLERLGTVSIVVHRAELLAALLEKLGAEKVHLGAQCVGIIQDKTGVCAQFADGKEVWGDVLIGADGLHSVIRSQLFGAAKPIYSGYTCWRGVAHISRTELEIWAWGKGYQFGVTPMTHDRAYWFAQKYAPEGEQDPADGKKHAMLELFKDWHDPIPAIIEATEETDILRNDIYESRLLRHWSRGRVTLLGDAAHTMTPNLGQGACQGIEDAVILAACLQAETDVVSALKLYDRQRIRRVNTITRMSGLIGRAVQMKNPLVSSGRNAIMKRLPVSVLLQSLMWILIYEA